MTNKRIISLACAGAIILAGVGGASAITAHNANRAAALEAEESMAALTVTNSTSISIDTPSVGTTATPTTSAKTTAADQGGSKTTSAPKTTAAVETTKITWTFNRSLSEQVAELLISKCPNFIGTLPPKEGRVLTDTFSLDERIDYSMLVKKITGDDLAKQIVDIWSPYINRADLSANAASVSVYIASDGTCAVFLNPGYVLPNNK